MVSQHLQTSHFPIELPVQCDPGNDCNACLPPHRPFRGPGFDSTEVPGGGGDFIDAHVAPDRSSGGHRHELSNPFQHVAYLSVDSEPDHPPHRPYASLHLRVFIANLSRCPLTLEEAAMVLGAGKYRAFIEVTLPRIKPGIAAAAIFSFVTSFDNITSSQFLVWDQTTLPIEIYAYITKENDPTVTAVSSLLILMTVEPCSRHGTLGRIGVRNRMR